jgi:hypothetical protein
VSAWHFLIDSFVMMWGKIPFSFDEMILFFEVLLMTQTPRCREEPSLVTHPTAGR